MSLSLVDVSKKLKRKDGFFQAKYNIKENNIQVLLHYCLKNVILDKHKQIQFGYNFWGKYIFKIGKDITTIKPKSNYIINSYIEHEAKAITNYYSIDIKYYGNLNSEKNLNIPFSKNKKIQLNTIDNKKITITKCTNGLKLSNKSLLITSKKTKIELSGKIFNLDMMKIYQIYNSEEIICKDIKNDIIAIHIN